VRSMRIQHNRTYIDEKYTDDFHIQVAVGNYYDMHLDAIVLGQQRVRLHDPNMRLVNWNYVALVLL
jgi:hypothetical protein